MPPATTTYKGLTVFTAPGATGTQHIEVALKALADRAGEVIGNAIINPTANDDSANTAGRGTFNIWSKWLNTITSEIFVCIDPTPTAAVWISTGGGAAGLGFDWQESVINILDFTAAEPAGPGAGDRYLNTGTGVGSVTGQAVVADHIYEWSGLLWEDFTPDEGAVTLDETSNMLTAYNGAAWVNIGTFALLTEAQTFFAATNILGAEAETLTDGSDAAGLHFHDMIDDVTPQLGADLDVQAFKITTSIVDGDIVVEPNGTGAFRTSSGGNARGDGAVDLQMSRLNAGEVASGDYSVIGGGTENTAGAVGSTVSGGEDNDAAGSYATVGGGLDHNAGSNYSTICGGYAHTAVQTYATICGGDSNTASATHSFVGGGDTNGAAADVSTICGGEGNDIVALATYGFIGGGLNNDIAASRTYSVIGGGQANEIKTAGTHGFIGGGQSNDVTAAHATVGGGSGNTSSGAYATIGGGYNNIASGAFGATVGGGNTNVASASYAAIAGGYDGLADQYGMQAHAAGKFVSNGDAQGFVVIMRDAVTHGDANWHELYLDGTADQLNIPVDTTWNFEAKIVGMTAGAAKSFAFNVIGLCENDGGTTTVRGMSVTTIDDADDVSFDAQAAADDPNDALKIEVMDADATGDVVQWVARVAVVSTTFPAP